METPQGGSERDKSNPTSSPASVVSNFWKDFELEREKSVLDEQGLRIAENQENSQKNRRKLAESTRDFKKASSDEKLGLFNSLLKGFQEEVDNLTKRAKFGENAFLNIYQKLYEAPDPYPSLASIAEQDLKLSELESENRKMKVELEEFRTEAAHLKNQQATIRRLEERNRQLEQQMEEKVKEIVEIKQRSLAEENQKTLEVLKEREQSLQDQLRQAKESVGTMQKLHELAQSQLFEVRAQSEEERAAKQSEVNLLMDEVERAQTRLLSLEREKGVLRSQLQSANEETENKKGDNSDSNSIFESSLNAKEKIISELNMELHNIETTLTNEREQHINEIKKLNTLLHEKASNYLGWRSPEEEGRAIVTWSLHFSDCFDMAWMGKCSDTERERVRERWGRMKESIREKPSLVSPSILEFLIKRLLLGFGYGLISHSKEFEEVALEEMKKVLQARPTEKLVDDLRKKVKILQVGEAINLVWLYWLIIYAVIVGLRLIIDKLQRSEFAIQSDARALLTFCALHNAVGYNSIEAEDWEVATSGEEMSKMESLLLDKNRKMEHELTQLKVKLSEKVTLLEAAEGKITELTGKVNEQQKLIQKLEDDISKGYSSKDRKGSLFEGWDLSEAGGAELSENSDQKHVSSDQDQSSMLKVICNQRDRFRARLQETEEEVRQLKEKIGVLTAELEKTKADNVKLYGKIRYVQDYNLEKVVSRGSKKHVEDLESGFTSDFESKYKKIYEDDINPFAAFSKKERDQRYKELGFRDRITLSSGRFLLATDPFPLIDTVIKLEFAAGTIRNPDIDKLILYISQKIT
ncbi:unnamed protein product [Dovyalis caffra]|uniref:Protein CASP n=1 Tax=Dovyalis caffra TaxID=77055 RepID=A0AAV1SFD6_9ROSI|nr:unnamed protein product [Dovyalis caffra]